MKFNKELPKAFYEKYKRPRSSELRISSSTQLGSEILQIEVGVQDDAFQIAPMKTDNDPPFAIFLHSKTFYESHALCSLVTVIDSSNMARVPPRATNFYNTVPITPSNFYTASHVSAEARGF
ncbi:hypothetical protein ACFE04_004045 [Oxalis oulophora]